MKKELKATGIVVEYNPFHNGHIHHINETKKVTPNAVIIAVMSPHFVQRGEPAIIHKWERTKVALDHGVDLVVELPTCYAIQSATYFAKAAIDILHLMRVSNIVFGSESADMKIIESDPIFDYSPSIGLAKVASNNKESNDILGYQYIKWAREVGITPHAIKRTNSYNSLDVSSPISSASAIRANVHTLDVTHTTPMIFEGKVLHSLEDYDSLIRYRLSLGTRSFNNNLMIDEGIENLLYKHRNLVLNDLLQSTTSKKYSTSRIRRTLMSCLLDIKKEDIKPITQVRVLGMNQRGQAYLRHLREQECSPVVPFKHYQFKDLELKASEIYASVMDEQYQKFIMQAEIATIIRK